ncbi:NAD-dependent epimerase/dehydratase family protein [Vibrio sp. F74]|uniref:NAD-dependent epimerase/dehydratase family protein n=1 Tax=Vibrio sp. F74 TaxID=700020 RepID=UPI0035F5D25D
MKRCLIIGGSGFIGREIVTEFRKYGCEVTVPKRGDLSYFKTKFDIVVYAAGFGDCTKPMSVLDANTSFFAKVLFEVDYNHLILLSSTRIYMSSEVTSENADLMIPFEDNRKLFNLSKMVSEELCRISKKNVTILRPSNVYGTAIESTLFLPMIIKNALLTGKIDMFVSPGYEKDYVSVDDVISIVSNVAMSDLQGLNIFNVASGHNISAQTIANEIVKETSCEIIWHKGHVGERFTPIDISYTKSNFKYDPKNLVMELPEIIQKFASHLLNRNSE